MQRNGQRQQAGTSQQAQGGEGGINIQAGGKADGDQQRCEFTRWQVYASSIKADSFGREWR